MKTRFDKRLFKNNAYLCGMKDEKRASQGTADSAFPALNLPVADLKLGRDEAGGVTVFDPLRRRRVRLTPEEWVRQHFTSYLIHYCGYPAGLLGNEVSITLNGMSRRCDSVLFGMDRQPRMIIEYKAPSVALTQRVFDQVWRYNTVLRVEWLIVSNGLRHVVCHLDKTTGTYEFLPQVPDYDAL